MSPRVRLLAATSLVAAPAWPVQSGEKSSDPVASAAARSGATAAPAVGKAGAWGDIGPSSLMSRFRGLRAGRPVKTLVRTVSSTLRPAGAERGAGEVRAPCQRRPPVLIW